VSRYTEDEINKALQIAFRDADNPDPDAYAAFMSLNEEQDVAYVKAVVDALDRITPTPTSLTRSTLEALLDTCRGVKPGSASRKDIIAIFEESGLIRPLTEEERFDALYAEVYDELDKPLFDVDDEKIDGLLESMLEIVLDTEKPVLLRMLKATRASVSVARSKR
jgi:hypothetical protein